jgi:hypothetical protein
VVEDGRSPHDVRMAEPQPVTVWMVHLRRAEVHKDIKGTLAVEEDVLAFAASTAREPTRFPFASITAVKRLRGSPVLMIEWRHEDVRRRTAFYFTQPPPLPPRAGGGDHAEWDAAPDRPNPLSAFRRNSKRRKMRVNTRYLQDVGISKKELIKSWADEVASRIGPAG